MNWTGTIPVFINNFNRLDSLRGMVDYLKDIPGTRTIIIDNGSTYPPLLKWYRRGCPCQIVYLEGNHGHHAPWRRNVIPTGDSGYEAFKQQWGSEWYAVTDPDLDLSGVPKDMMEVLVRGMELWGKNVKCGLSLEIDDVPPWAQARCERNERHFWSEPLDGQFFRAPVDTTFSVYRATTGARYATCIEPAIRTNRPYTARHIPWYADPANLSEEDRYYYAHAGKSATWRP